MFMSRREGKKYEQSGFSNHWKSLMRKWGGPVEGPHYLRHVFIAERACPEAIAGPSEAGAAAAIGNSTSSWDIWYRHKLANAEAQRFVDGQAQWRKALLIRRAAAQAASAAVKAKFAASGNAARVKTETLDVCSSSESDVEA